MPDHRHEFKMSLDMPGLPKTVPIYDLVLCRGGMYVAAVCPYYARSAWEGVGVIINGKPVSWWMDEDPEHFVTIVYCDVPPCAIHAEFVDVCLRKQGQVVYEGKVRATFGLRGGTVAMSTLAKFDWPWIAEWVQHHYKLGVDHFYVYNNGERRLTEELEFFVERGIVTEIAWPYPYVLYPWHWVPLWPEDCHWYCQCPQMMHTVLKYGDNWTWLGFFDADEFLVPSGRRTRLGGVLDPSTWKADRTGSRLGELRIHGKWFGNSRHRQRPAGSIRENYLRCERGCTSPTKCFVRPQAVRYTRIHWWTVEGESRCVLPSQLRFNHYRGISDHNVRRSAQYDNEFTNEDENREVLTWA
jgi:hypothetical protein